MKEPSLSNLLSTPAHAASWTARLVLAAGVLSLSTLDARSAVIDWSGLSSVTNGWADPNNWSPAQVPGGGNSVLFTNAGAVGTIGAVNNTVGAGMAVSNLTYASVSPGGTTIEADTTAIPAGVTLALGSQLFSSNAPVLYVGADGVNTSDVVYANIAGAGTLAVGNLAAPDTNQNVLITTRAITANSGTHSARLDMSGLNTFTYGGGRFHVGSDGVSQATYPTRLGYTLDDRANGSVVLAKINIITAATPTVATSASINFPYAAPAFAIGANPYANGGGVPIQCLLGQQNTIYADGIIVGGARCAIGATMMFQSNYAGLNPTVKFRGANGIGRVTGFGIGDNGPDHATTVVTIGTLDLSLGSVDALIDVMNVGRCSPINTATGLLASATGTATLAAGTCDVATLNIGVQRGNVSGTSTGTFNVLGTANLTCGAINIGTDNSTLAGTGNGTLNISGGQVTVSGDILENDIPGQRGTSAISIQNGGSLNMEPAGDTVPGNILSLGTLNWDFGTLTNYGILGVSFINQPNAVDFNVYPGQTLAPLAPGLIGTLAVQAGLVLNSATVSFDLNNPSSTNDQIIVTNKLTLNGVSTVDVNPINGIIAPGTYTLMTYGSLSGNAANLQLSSALAHSRYTAAIDTSITPDINLNISGSASSLTWSGDGVANNWDLNTTANWAGDSQTFYDLDTVTFDDSGSENPAVNLIGTLVPASITVNTGNAYTFAGTGKISGDTGLTNLGGGVLTIANTNDYTGVTTISNGTVLVNGKLGNTAVNVANAATLGGTGTIVGSVTVNTFCVLSPGNANTPIGTLTMSNILTLAANSLSEFDVDMDALVNDQVVGLNKVTYGGILDLNLSGRPLVYGDTLKLFSAKVYSGAFSSIIPSSPGPGLLWNTNLLSSSGTLGVTAPVPVITSIVNIGGGNLQISGKGGYPGGSYSVVASSDMSIPVGSWPSINSGGFDGSGNFSFTVAISPAQQFFALSTTP